MTLKFWMMSAVMSAVVDVLVVSEEAPKYSSNDSENFIH